MTSVRVGVVILPEFSWREAQPRWKSLQDRGFAHAWTYDHLAWRDLADGPWYATVPTLAAAATATSTLRLGTWVASPNFRHPVTFGKDLLTLDDISGGRIIAGLGSGGIGWDADVLGTAELTPRDRHDRFAEWLALLDRLLREGEVSAAGEYYRAVRARTIPAGSRDRLELVVAAGGPRALRLAARFDGWATYGIPSRSGTPDQWWAGLAELSDRFDELTAQQPPDRPTPRRYLNLDQGDYSLTDLDRFVDDAGRAAALGFTDVVVHWPRATGIYAGDETMLDRVAELLSGGEFRP